MNDVILKDWFATSDYGYEVDNPTAVFDRITVSDDAPAGHKIASGIDVASHARLLASATQMARTLMQVRTHLHMMDEILGTKNMVAAIQVISESLQKAGLE